MSSSSSSRTIVLIVFYNIYLIRLTGTTNIQHSIACFLLINVWDIDDVAQRENENFGIKGTVEKGTRIVPTGNEINSRPRHI